MLTFCKRTAQTLRGCQYVPDSEKGHYESYFLRANHPEKAQGFWIRYTLFSPRGRPDKALGEIWAVFFDGESDRMTAVQEEFPLSQCAFSAERMAAQVGNNTLESGRLRGSSQRGSDRMDWDLTYGGEEPPILLLPEALYHTRLPKAKALVTAPNVQFDGLVRVNGTDYVINAWQGSENHNWGSKHTDEYAWGQVAGFDNAPAAFLECSTARLKLGPVWSPWLTVAVVRWEGRTWHFNNLLLAVKAKARYRQGDWQFETANQHARLTVRFGAPASHFVSLTYKNPPGGACICLNSKIAACEITLEEKGGASHYFRTRQRAAFEMLS